MREPNPLSTRLHGRVIAGSFRPHPLARGPHAQTLVTLLRPMPALELRIERLELPDGDFLDLGWCGDGNAGPLVVLLHGLSGGFDSKYARGLARRMVQHGWRAVILQFRGAGPEPNRLPKSYHHGATEDVRELLALLRAREPETPLFAVGWSLGGNVLLKYLGEDGARTPLAAGVAVCAPYQLRPCAERLRTGFSRIYQRHLLGELKAMIRRKAAAVPLGIDLEKALASRDFFEFDDAVTCPLNGFRDADDYYSRAACGRFLGGIAVPTLAIHAKDDPFMAPEIIPDAAHLPPGMTLELCEHGGHVGFVAAGLALVPRFWLEERIPRFLLEQPLTRAR